MKVYEYKYIESTVEEDREEKTFFSEYSEMLEFAQRRDFKKNHQWNDNLQLKEGTDYIIHEIGNKMEETTVCKTCGKAIPKYHHLAAAVKGAVASQCEECFGKENNPFAELGIYE